MAQWISSIGLALDIIGVLLIWKYGIPNEVRRGGIQSIDFEGPDLTEAEKARRYGKWSNIGLGLLLFGFVLQLLSNWI